MRESLGGHTDLNENVRGHYGQVGEQNAETQAMVQPIDSSKERCHS